ncbi:MAG: hypothetical protein EOP83_26115, partial [Verrucomicrobiaceae bacterium]
ALKYLIHLVGDLHQPLHGSDPIGYNLVTLNGSSPVTIHAIWDDTIINDHGTVAEQILRVLWKSAAEFVLVLGVQSHQHRLIITCDLFGRLIAETAEEGIARFTGTAAELEFRFTLGDANQAHEFSLKIALDRAMQKLVLPVRPAAHIEHPLFIAGPFHRH